tara:strand:- start:107 stop:262 length:156 start_codon:yes stop_codon:yes gene_type:complete
MTKLEELKAEIDDLYQKADAAEREYRHLLTLAHYASRLYEIELVKVGEINE